MRAGLTTGPENPGGSCPPGRTWVVHPLNAVDISAASEWGSVRYVNNRYVYPDELDNDNRIPKDFMDRLKSAADEFDPESDSLIMVGDHVQVAALVYYLSTLRKTFRLLRFDRHVGRYVPVTIG